jgi:hypothetical protein
LASIATDVPAGPMIVWTLALCAFGFAAFAAVFSRRGDQS